GGDNYSSTLDNAVQYAWGKGCVIVAAAGNSGTTQYEYPAALPHVISVAATDSTDTLTVFSNYGSWVKVAAPGGNIYSTLPGSSYAFKSGTSMACPHVAGEAALIWSHSPQLFNSQVANLVTSKVDHYNPYSGRTIAPGAGRINVFRALKPGV